MKKRISRVVNFFAFNLLFFALYLNFIHKDANTQEALPQSSTAPTAKGTTLVEHPEQYVNASFEEKAKTEASDKTQAKL